MVDVFHRSLEYNVELYVADRQRNPFNLERAYRHVVIPDLNVEDIVRFAVTNRSGIDLGVVGPENPIVAGVRDLVERQTGIPMICPTRDYALEGSKVQQRRLFEALVPEANPRFRVFDPREYSDLGKTRRDVYEWLDELGNEAVVKPDRPAVGKGVGVWGDHFSSREDLFSHFLANLKHGSVVIEERIQGEESSFQTMCDGKHLVPLPDTRDYKRAFDGDRGPNTGGMGSYKSKGDVLPFLNESDREMEVRIADKLFRKWGLEDKTALRGFPFYLAFMHSKDGPKILENNSRPGDPEAQNLLPLLKDDLVDMCFKMLEGSLTRIDVERRASVVVYKAPHTYAGFNKSYPSMVRRNEIGEPIDLNRARDLQAVYGDDLRIYPASVELRGNEIHPLGSRAVCFVGIGDDIELARETSMRACEAVHGGALWHRTDIASREHIEASTLHMARLKSPVSIS